MFNVNNFILYAQYLGWGKNEQEVRDRVGQANRSYVRTTDGYTDINFKMYTHWWETSSLSQVAINVLIELFYVNVKYSENSNYSYDNAKEDALNLMYTFFMNTGYMLDITPNNPFVLEQCMMKKDLDYFMSHVHNYWVSIPPLVFEPLQVDYDELKSIANFVIKKLYLKSTECSNLLKLAKQEKFYQYCSTAMV